MYKIKWFIWGFLLIAMPIFAQVGGYDPALLMNQSRSVPDPSDKAAIIQAFQSMYLKKVFLKPAFSNSMRYYSEDSKSENKAGHGIYEEFFIQHLADHLAEQDILQLNDRLSKELDSE